MFIDVHAHIFPEIHGLTRNGPTRSLGYGFASEGDRPVRILPPYAPETAYTPEMLIANMDWAGVEKAVLLQGSFYGGLNDYVAQAIRHYPGRLAGFAYLDPWMAGWKERLAQIIAWNAFAGIKLECSEGTGFCGIYPQAWLDDKDLDWLWSELQRHRFMLVLDLGAVGSRSYQTGAVHRIAEVYPGLHIVIAHLGQLKPEVEANPQAMKLWEKQISLGLLSNIWFDCAALPAYLPDEDYPYPTAGKYIRMAIEKVGPAKVMWGTDQPGLLSLASLPELVKMARYHTAFLPPEHQRMVLRENAQRLFFDSPIGGDR